MSVKRPRPSNNETIRCGQWTGGGGSQLRGILESKDNQTVTSSSSLKLLSPVDLSKMEVKRENCTTGPALNSAVPRSVSQALGAQIQHRFTSILEQPPAFVMPKPHNGTFNSHSSSSTQYPSSPSSSTSFCTDSPPEGHSPASNTAGVPVPIFALHPLGLFYVPMIVNSSYLDMNFQNLLTTSFVERTAEQVQSALAVSHPVTISVNFNFNAYGSGPSHAHNNHDQRLERAQTVQQSSVILTTSSLSRSTL